MQEFEPDLAIGTTPVVQKAKEHGDPGAVFHQSDFGAPADGAAGAGSLAQVINAAVAGKARFDEMKEFFAGVGEGHAAGVWEEIPTDRPEFRKRQLRQERGGVARSEEPV